MYTNDKRLVALHSPRSNKQFYIFSIEDWMGRYRNFPTALPRYQELSSKVTGYYATVYVVGLDVLYDYPLDHPKDFEYIIEYMSVIKERIQDYIKNGPDLERDKF